MKFTEGIVQAKTMLSAHMAIALSMFCLGAMQLSIPSHLLKEKRVPTLTNNGASSIQSTKDIINLETDIVKTFDNISNYLNAVTDTRTASLVEPHIEIFSAQLDEIFARIPKLPTADQDPVRIIANERLELLKLLVDEIMRIPEVETILKPNVAPLIRRLQKLVEIRTDANA